jgi:hypothetical protein
MIARAWDGTRWYETTQRHRQRATDGLLGHYRMSVADASPGGANLKAARSIGLLRALCGHAAERPRSLAAALTRWVDWQPGTSTGWSCEAADETERPSDAEPRRQVAPREHKFHF